MRPTPNDPTCDPLAPGQRVGALCVVISNSVNLEFKARLTPVLKWFSGAILCGLFAAGCWYGLLTHAGTGNMEFLIFITFLPVALLATAVAHLGLRLRIDGHRKIVTRERLSNVFGAEWTLDDLKAVRLEIRNGGRANGDTCVLSFVDSRGALIPSITERRVDLRDSQNLVPAARQIATLLSIPLQVRGETKRGNKLFTTAFAAVKTVH